MRTQVELLVDKVTDWFIWESIWKAKGGHGESEPGIMGYWNTGRIENGGHQSKPGASYCKGWVLILLVSPVRVSIDLLFPIS